MRESLLSEGILTLALGGARHRDVEDRGIDGERPQDLTLGRSCIQSNSWHSEHPERVMHGTLRTHGIIFADVRPKPYTQNHPPKTIRPKRDAQKHRPTTMRPKPYDQRPYAQSQTLRPNPYTQNHTPKTIPQRESPKTIAFYTP